MHNLNYIYPEIFVSLSIMFLLLFGVFKKNSSNLIYNLARPIKKKEEINLRTIVNLPNGNGKKIKIAVLCEESKIS